MWGKRKKAKWTPTLFLCTLKFQYHTRELRSKCFLWAICIPQFWYNEYLTFSHPPPQFQRNKIQHKGSYLAISFNICYTSIFEKINFSRNSVKCWFFSVTPPRFFWKKYCENIKIKRLGTKSETFTFIFIPGDSLEFRYNFVHAIFPHGVTHSCWKLNSFLFWVTKNI